MTRDLWKKPSGLVPIGMSLVALGIVLGYAAIFGVARQADEGTAAHLWQLLMAGQLPVVAFFAIKWFPKAPKEAASVLALQFAAALSALFPVWYFHW